MVKTIKLPFAQKLKLFGLSTNTTPKQLRGMSRVACVPSVASVRLHFHVLLFLYVSVFTRLSGTQSWN